jgi:hypothetical protein
MPHSSCSSSPREFRVGARSCSRPAAVVTSSSDRRERLEKHDREGIAFVWLGLSEIESILRAFDVLDAAGALTLEERVLQEDLIDLISGGNAPVIETP